MNPLKVTLKSSTVNSFQVLNPDMIVLDAPYSHLVFDHLVRRGQWPAKYGDI